MNRTGNGNSPVANDPGELERRHFEATRELLELRAKLRSRVGVPSGQAGHLRSLQPGSRQIGEGAAWRLPFTPAKNPFELSARD